MKKIIMFALIGALMLSVNFVNTNANVADNETGPKHIIKPITVADNETGPKVIKPVQVADNETGPKNIIVNPKA